VDDRPLSFGIEKPSELFTDRQLVVFGLAFHWIKRQRLSRDVRRAIRLAVSNALTTNNRLCSYAAEYGRLAPLFSVRSYSLPTLAVELNPLHPSAGRGTLRRSIDRVVRSTSGEVRRYVWSVTQRRPVPANMRFPRRPSATGIVCASAESRPTHLDGPIDLCLFDPPYFDYIAYSELSEFYRAWVGRSRLGGTPLLPDRGDPVRTFSDRLTSCLLAVKPRLRKRCPMVFTYHSASADAWSAIGQALDGAGMRITALWPLRNDSHMGHHSSDGNCEWDLVVVCRRKGDCAPATLDSTAKEWAEAAKPLRIRPVDRRSMTYAIEMASSRYGRPLTHRAKGTR
jgi:adenine-specific DNA methylase